MTHMILVVLLLASRGGSPSQGLPPLIDRELLFGNPEIAGAQLSPDGKFLAFLKPWKDTRNIWVKKTGEPFTAARLLTTEAKRPVAGYFWTRDGKFVLLRQGQRRRRELQPLCGRPGGAAPAGAEAPPSRDLTGLKGVVVQLYSAPKNDPDTALHRHQRSRQGLARSLQAQDLHRREDAGPQEHREGRGLDLSTSGTTAPGRARRR